MKKRKLALFIGIIVIIAQLTACGGSNQLSGTFESLRMANMRNEFGTSNENVSLRFSGNKVTLNVSYDVNLNTHILREAYGADEMSDEEWQKFVEENQTVVVEVTGKYSITNDNIEFVWDEGGVHNSGFNARDAASLAASFAGVSISLSNIEVFSFSRTENTIIINEVQYNRSR